MAFKWEDVSSVKDEKIESIDNTATRSMSAEQMIHNYRMHNVPEYAKYIASKTQLEDEDKPLQEASFDVLPLAVSKMSKFIPSGNRITVYHGTSPATKERILETGLAARYSGEPGTLTAKALEGTEAGELSKGAVYTTTSKWDAARYAASHAENGTRVDNTASVPEQLRKLGRQIKAYVTSDGIVEAALPMTYKSSEIWNPEFRAIVQAGVDELPSKYAGLADRSEAIRTIYGNVAFGNDRVFRSDIPTRYLVGSKDYVDDSNLGLAALLTSKGPSDAIYGGNVTASNIKFSKHLVDSAPRRAGVQAVEWGTNAEE